MPIALGWLRSITNDFCRARSYARNDSLDFLAC